MTGYYHKIALDREQMDEVAIKVLKNCRASLRSSLRNAKAGDSDGMFDYDPEREADAVQKRLNAIEMVLSFIDDL